MINPNNNLILIKNEDKTENIEKWTYSDGCYIITFCGGQTYKYNYLNVKFYKNPHNLDLRNIMIMKNGISLYAVKQVLMFEYHSKIIYDNGYKETVENQFLYFCHSALCNPKSSECFEYFKQVAIQVGLQDEKGNNILANRYQKIEFIREDSVLAGYLSGNLGSTSPNRKPPIYPFGFNLSQKQAVEHAMLYPLSVIEGPPGTGKTQTILNIIANAIMNGESVAVVSSNNSATQNVLDKLNKYGIGFIAAYLGNGSNKQEFIDNQIPVLPSLTGWYLEQKIYYQIQNDLAIMASQLDSMLATKNELSILMQQKDALIVEYKHYMNYYNETNRDDAEMVVNSGTSSEKILKLLVSLENEQDRKNTFWNYIYYAFRFGVRNKKFLNNTQDRKVATCQKLFYELRLKELDIAIEQKKDLLADYNFNEKMELYTQKSMLLLRANIALKYTGQAGRTIYTLDDLWKNSEQFIRDYPIILSTTYSLRSSLSSRYVYDYVIVDEASQVDLATGVLTLSCAKKAVIVGDLKQLPNVVTNEIRQKTDQIFDMFALNNAYQYSANSLLSSVTRLFPNVSHTLLREHYRCHPKIIGFCNQRFYNNALIILTEATQEKEPLIVYRTVKGNHKRENVNVRQVEVIEKEVIPQQHLDVKQDSIGIVTPYRKQTEYLQEVFKNTKVKADTVDKFQGQECDTIILSTVDDDISEFADDANRLNVAVSRAKNQLIVVTDGNASQKKSNLKDLIDYIEYNNFTVVDSNVYSIFDYLYKAYYETRVKYLQDKNKVSEYDSENLMYAVIQDLLHTNADFEDLDVAVHVPLRMIIRDVSLLGEEAIRYLMASGTHVDFVIYSIISKKMILVIEVDGYRYHKEGTRQAERDKLKNEILDLYGVPYIRFATNGSGEREVLRCRLRELL